MAATTAEQVIVEIVRTADGEFCGKTRLFKAFYFAHLAYYEANPGLLTDWPIARMPNGPGIDRAEEVLASLVDKRLLDIEIYHESFYPEYRYRLTKTGQAAESLGEKETLAIRRSVEFVAGKSGAELSHYTHEYSRSWNAAKNGDILNIYIDLIPDDEYVRRQRDLCEIDEQLKLVM